MTLTRLLQSMRSNPRRVAFIVVLVLDVCLTLFVFRQIARYADYPFDSDEGFHAQGGLELALDLHSGNWKAFLLHAYRQATYPPVFSVVEALSLLTFGFSTVVARTTSLLCLSAALLVIYAIGLELDDVRGWLVGFVGATLTMMGQPTLANSALVMLEPIGLLASLGTLWAYLRADTSPGSRRFALVGVLIGTTFLTKYPYGIVVGCTVLISELVHIGTTTGHSSEHHPNTVTRRWLWLFGPLVLILFAWFVGPGKVGTFFAYATAQRAQVKFFSLENLLFYPRSFAYHYAPSPVWTVVSLASMVWAFTQCRNTRLRATLIYAGVGFAVMTGVLQKLPRFVVTVVPAIHLVTGVLLAWVVQHWADRAAARRRMAVIAGVVTLICAITSVSTLIDRAAGFPGLMLAEYETDPRANDLAGWITSRIPPDQPIVLVNPWDQFHASALEWYRATHEAPLPREIEDVRVAYVSLGGETRVEAARLQEEMRRHRATYLVVLEGGRRTVGSWPAYEAALGNRLALVDRRQWSLDFYDMADWMRMSMITRARLRAAMVDHHRVLRIHVSVYKVDSGSF